jgi:membrane-associated protein
VAEVAFHGRVLDARACLSLGLVNTVVPAERLMGEARAWAAEIASCALAAIQATKRMMRLGLEASLEANVHPDGAILNGRCYAGMKPDTAVAPARTAVSPSHGPFGTRMDHLTSLLIDLIRTLFERWGYLVVFLGTMAENMLFLGLFIPGVFVLLLAGLSAEQGLIDIRLALVLAVLGTSIGDTVSYLAGRFGWRRMLARAEKLPFMGTVQNTLQQRTGIFVLSYHFLGYTRVLGPMMSGVSRIPFRRWYLTDLFGAIVWVSVYMLGGYALGSFGISLESANNHVQTLDWILIGLAAVGVAAFFLIRIRARRRQPVAETVEGE